MGKLLLMASRIHFKAPEDYDLVFFSAQTVDFCVCSYFWTLRAHFSSAMNFFKCVSSRQLIGRSHIYIYCANAITYNEISLNLFLSESSIHIYMYVGTHIYK